MASPMQVPTRRFLYVKPPRQVTLAPIYLALLVLVALALLGLLVAVWAPASEPGARRQLDGDRPDDSRSFGGSYLPAPPSKPARSGTWM
jgi:hypothetical protein